MSLIEKFGDALQKTRGSRLQQGSKSGSTAGKALKKLIGGDGLSPSSHPDEYTQKDLSEKIEESKNA
jgi:hypothetical protein